MEKFLSASIHRDTCLMHMPPQLSSWKFIFPQSPKEKWMIGSRSVAQTFPIFKVTRAPQRVRTGPADSFTVNLSKKRVQWARQHVRGRLFKTQTCGFTHSVRALPPLSVSLWAPVVMLDTFGTQSAALSVPHAELQLKLSDTRRSLTAAGLGMDKSKGEKLLDTSGPILSKKKLLVVLDLLCLFLGKYHDQHWAHESYRNNSGWKVFAGAGEICKGGRWARDLH